MHQRYVTIGLLLVALHTVLPASSGRDLLHVAIGASCVVAMLVGVLRGSVGAAMPWLFMAAGQTCWVAGDWLLKGVPREDTSWADVCYVAAYPLVALGIADLIRRRMRRNGASHLVDSSIIGLAIALVAWVYVVDPILHDVSRPLAERVVMMAYPLGDTLLVALVIALVLVPGVRSTSYRLLAGSIAVLVVADLVFVAGPAYLVPGVETLWLLSYVAWGAAALHPTASSISDVQDLYVHSARRLAVLAVAALIAPMLVVMEIRVGTHVDTWLVVAGASGLSLLVLARVSLNVGELHATARQRDELQARLLHEASHDALTGAPNGASMRQLIGSALRRGQRNGTATTVLLVEIDAFDDLVARHGRAVGHEVLRVVATRLQALIADPEQTGRIGGHRFALVAEPALSDGELAALDQQLKETVCRPIDVKDLQLHMSVCVGVAMSMDGGTDVDGLIDQAHVALRRAKVTGRGSFEVFGDGHRREMLERRDVESALREALVDEGLALHFQPVVAVQTRIVDAYEAKVRWWRPGRGWQDSERFRAVASDTDLICQIDLWAIKTALNHLATWTDRDPEHFADLSVAVPIAGRTLSSPGFVDAVVTLLSRTGVEPHRLTIGVTEMTLVDAPHAVLDLTMLRDRGVCVSITEFGTGHTPIGRLSRLPADVLKIDDSLVTSREPGAADLLALLVNAAHGCGMLAVVTPSEDHERVSSPRAAQRDDSRSMHPSVFGRSGHGTPSATRTRPRLFVVPDPWDA